MTHRRIAAAGPYAASVVGVVGFGTLYRGVAGHSLPAVLLGLALALFGLERAGRALAASILMAEARRATRDGSGGGG